MRTKHWEPHIEAIMDWVEEKFKAAKYSLWDYVDGRVGFAKVGITKEAFFEQLAGKIAGSRQEGQSDESWWSAVHNRIYYLFHDSSDEKPRPRCWGEWSRAIPPRPDPASEAAEATSEAAEAIPSKAAPEERDPQRSFPRRMVEEALKRQSGRCYFHPECQAVFSDDCRPVGHHKIAHALGGPTNQDNCAAVCVRCNLGCGTTDPVAYFKHLRILNRMGRKGIV